jgi:hypothetical protein
VPATGCVHTDISQNCNDNNACTDDSCNPETGCVHTPSTNPQCNELNHFQCYEIKPFAFGRRSASVVDRYGSATVSIRTPNRLCAPSDKRGEDPTAPQDPEHLMGYPDIAGPIRVQNQTIENQFGRVTVNLVRRAFLFVPASKSLQSPPPPLVNPSTDHFQCYLVKRATGTPKFTTIPCVAAVDQFGSHAGFSANALLRQPTRTTAPPRSCSATGRVCVRSGDKEPFTNDQFGPSSASYATSAPSTSVSERPHFGAGTQGGREVRPPQDPRRTTRKPMRGKCTTTSPSAGSARRTATSFTEAPASVPATGSNP